MPCIERRTWVVNREIVDDNNNEPTRGEEQYILYKHGQRISTRIDDQKNVGAKTLSHTHTCIPKASRYAR